MENNTGFDAIEEVAKKAEGVPEKIGASEHNPDHDCDSVFGAFGWDEAYMDELDHKCATIFAKLMTEDGYHRSHAIVDINNLGATTMQKMYMYGKICEAARELHDASKHGDIVRLLKMLGCDDGE